MNLSNKTIVITGAANGMGRETALLMLSKGAKVAAVDMSEDALNQLKTDAEKYKSKLSTHVVNITNKADVDKLPEEVIAIHGAVDGLINNAGIIQPFVRINDLNFEQIERVMNVNFYGALYMLKAFLPHFLKRPEAHIVNISSMGGFLPVPGQSIYGASKAAIKLMTEGLMAELRETNVHVSVVYPGAIGTNITQNSGVEMPSMGNMDAEKAKARTLAPSKAAEIIVNGIEANKQRIFVGSDSKMMNFLYRMSPGFATNFIAKQMKNLLK
ncbi:MAG: SDR family NAD(P)-dependent oxidoreductase [Bacteroidia bacterium]